MSLNANAILVNCIMHQMNFSKLDKKVSQETANTKGAKQNATRVYKSLIASTALKPIKDAMRDAYKYHTSMTLPFYDKGARLLPSTEYFDYCSKMGGFKNDVIEAVDVFIEEYQLHIYNAMQDLGDMFNESDFPDVSVIRRKFGIEIEMLPVPETSSLSQLAFSDKDQKALEDSVEDAMNKKIEAAMADVWKRAYTAVKAMADRLKKEDSKFHNSLVQNLKDIVDLMPALNITNDRELAAAYRSIKENLYDVDAGILRKDKVVRKEVAEEAAVIAEVMSTYF